MVDKDNVVTAVNCPSDDGMLPVNALLNKLKNVSALSSDSNAGIVPVREFWSIRKYWSAVSSESNDGIVPVRALTSQIQKCKYRQYRDTEYGMVPVKALCSNKGTQSRVSGKTVPVT